MGEYKIVQIIMDVKMPVQNTPQEVLRYLQVMLMKIRCEDMSGHQDFIDFTDVYDEEN